MDIGYAMTVIWPLPFGLLLFVMAWAFVESEQRSKQEKSQMKKKKSNKKGC